MASTTQPADAPPSYAQATGDRNSHQTRNGIPPEHRRSMEDQFRPLPAGWVRQFDAASEHQFFVDTTKEPPRSIWHHPYDDDEYLNSLSREERQHITRLHRSVSLLDIAAESSDDDHHVPSKKPSASAKKLGDTATIGGGAAATAAASSSSAAAGPSAAAGEEPPTGIKKFGRRLKDRVTNSTHQEREQERDQRAREEEEAYRLHIAFRNAMSRAIQTGQPQYLGRDKDGREMYIEPPNGPMPLNARGVPGGALGYSPYQQGPYANPNSRFLRPTYPYQRPYGYGYGGGYGMPIMGGLLGGALLGGLLF